ncbi:zinc finger protein 37-like [Penaeus chinensis]|uniref:zinc finger protein 37-like n=1 Tax=Penaeus chinensis TaxID=139456 RepID=UPI001FB5A2AF|nr:zinc finger protein 37-like [Penaeus chinensis]
MGDSKLDMEVPDNAIEFIAVKEEIIEDVNEVNNHRIKVLEDSDGVNAVYIKTEKEVDTDYESPVKKEINNLKEAVTNVSDNLMCEEEDPLLLPVPFTFEVCENLCSPDQTLHKKDSDEETRKKSETKGKCFYCEICDKKLPCKSKLLVHMRVHTREKPYNCEICNQAFSQKHHMVEHMRIHTQEKPYICDICSKPFCGRSNLVKHMRVHTKERPYSCDICSKAFPEKIALDRHVRVHTREKPDSILSFILHTTSPSVLETSQISFLYSEDSDFHSVEGMQGTREIGGKLTILLNALGSVPCKTTTRGLPRKTKNLHLEEFQKVNL